MDNKDKENEHIDTNVIKNECKITQQNGGEHQEDTSVEDAMRDCVHQTLTNPIYVVLLGQHVVLCTTCGKVGKIEFGNK